MIFIYYHTELFYHETREELLQAKLKIKANLCTFLKPKILTAMTAVTAATKNQQISTEIERRRRNSSYI
jgi:hypothetical protein